MTKLYRGLAYFHVSLVEAIEEAARKHPPGEAFELALSLDLNVSFQKMKVTPEGGGYVLSNESGFMSSPENVFQKVPVNDRLVALLKDSPGKVFAVDIEKYEATPLHFSSEYGNVKLVYTPKSPTMEIDGVKMHRSMDIDPWEDSRLKVADVVKRGMDVLDTCTGLGYTAIIAAQKGAASVITFERNPAVLKIVSYNPWSKAFFEHQSIDSREGDTSEEITAFKDGQFDAIIHDPPRFSHAGQLYSIEFYNQAFRVLSPGGRMFHYIGDPDSSFGKKHYGGINNRLREAGFETAIIKRSYGILCRK